MAKKVDEYDVSKGMLGRMNVINENAEKRRRNGRKGLLKEERDSDKGDAIAITNDARFGQNVLQNQIDSFRKTVSPGARFSDENAGDAESNPLVYFRKTKNLVFSGSIPSMSDLKFQYSLNDVTDAPYIFVDGLALTDDVITTLNKMKGHYKNWKDEFLVAGDLLDKIDADADNRDRI